MSKVTEEDILNQYMPLVVKECKDSYKGLEWEDRVGEGAEALIYAIRTYKIKYGSFEDFMVLHLRRIMRQKNKEAWAMKKLESQYSLDAPLVNGKENYSLSILIGGAPQDETILDVKYFMESLSSTEKIVMDLLINDCKMSNALSKLSLSSPQDPIIGCLKDKVSAYFGKDH